MNTEFVQAWLISKYAEIEKRWLTAMEQLSVEQLNWRPNDSSNSIANLVVHIRGNVAERISRGILHEHAVRDRDAEFQEMVVGKEELVELVREAFAILIRTVGEMTPSQFDETQVIRGRERPHSEVLLQCASHFSEHLGQVLYVAKQCLGEAYETTSIVKRK